MNSCPKCPHFLFHMSEIWCNIYVHNAVHICNFRENRRWEGRLFLWAWMKIHLHKSCYILKVGPSKWQPVYFLFEVILLNILQFCVFICNESYLVVRHYFISVYYWHLLRRVLIVIVVIIRVYADGCDIGANNETCRRYCAAESSGFCTRGQSWQLLQAVTSYDISCNRLDEK